MVVVVVVVPLRERRTVQTVRRTVRWHPPFLLPLQVLHGDPRPWPRRGSSRVQGTVTVTVTEQPTLKPKLQLRYRTRTAWHRKLLLWRRRHHLPGGKTVAVHRLRMQR
jgi:hypothetical protein